jgi:hypothetical protein
MSIVKTNWFDEGLHKTYGDNNDGLIHGINYIDDELNETVECRWFRTKAERNHRYKMEREKKC